MKEPKWLKPEVALAVIEATEEAIYNALLKATTVTGRGGFTSEALPIDKLLEVGVLSEVQFKMHFTVLSLHLFGLT